MASELAELSAEQRAAAEEFVQAAERFWPAMQRLEQVGLSIADVLRRVPGENGRSVFDELPPHLRMMLG